AGRGRQEAREERRERRLAAARRTEHRERAARRYAQRDAVEHLAIAVREVEILDLDRAGPLGLERLGRLDDVRLGVEDLADAGVRRAPPLHDREDVAEGQRRPDEEAEVGVEGRELAGGELTLEH